MRKNYISPMAKVLTLNVKNCICESEITESGSNGPDRPDDILIPDIK